MVVLETAAVAYTKSSSYKADCLSLSTPRAAPKMGIEKFCAMATLSQSLFGLLKHCTPLIGRRSLIRATMTINEAAYE
jgi:hypothetical protein